MEEAVSEIISVNPRPCVLDEARKGFSGYQPDGCWAEEGAVPLDLANAQGDEGYA